MGKGSKYTSEKRILTDPVSGQQITQWTTELCHSYHLYFTNNGWYDNDTKLLIGSDRDRAGNLYSLDLTDGGLTQLTAYAREEQAGPQTACLSRRRHVVFLTVHNQIRSVQLDTLEEDTYYEVPAGYHFSGFSVTADEREIIVGIVEDVHNGKPHSLGSGYIGFIERERARPHSQIISVSIDTKEHKLIHEEHRWIGHVNTSPTQPHLFSFCHEGPWDVVDHRIWMFDRQANRAYPLGVFKDREYAGHEYWYADGLHIGFHGYTDSLDRQDGKFIGSIKYDNTGQEQYSFPYQNMHIHSNHDRRIVGDGQQRSAYHGETYQDSIFLWQKTEGEYKGPYVLCQHRGSFQAQVVHVHPRLSPDGQYVVFTSDMDGYGQVYTVDIPEQIDQLPLLQQL